MPDDRQEIKSLVATMLEDRDMKFETEIAGLSLQVGALARQVSDLESKLEKHTLEESVGMRSVANKLDHVYAVINVHNDEYSKMRAQFGELAESNRNMVRHLDTLAQLQAMLTLAKNTTDNQGAR